MSAEPLGVAVVGAGLIGSRRARILAEAGGPRLVGVADAVPERAAALADEHGCRTFGSWREAVLDRGVDAVVVATTNDALAAVTIAALEAGKHVLCEKPAGRTAAEARRMADAADRARRTLCFGFNHRHTESMVRAVGIVRSGGIGAPLWLRGRYGHGGRPGLEREWRADPQRSGGGELIDQGSHLIDLARLMLGPPTRVHCVARSLVWAMKPLEDNAFCLLEHGPQRVSQFHVSINQWKNLFSLEIHGDAGAVIVEGLGGSYGPERVTWHRRKPGSGPPVEERFEFDAPLASWEREWRRFVEAIAGVDPPLGEPSIASAEEGVEVMETVDALYRSAREAGRVDVEAKAITAAGGLG